MPEARCRECGAHYAGWALEQEEHKSCITCGGALVPITTLQS